LDDPRQGQVRMIDVALCRAIQEEGNKIPSSCPFC